MSTNKELQELKRIIFTVFALSIFIVILLGVFIFFSGLICGPASVITKTMSGDNILANYEWFHLTYEDIKAAERKIENTKFILKNVKDKEKYTTVLLGLQNYVEDLIAEYNSKSKMLNRKLFKDKNLPYQIGIGKDKINYNF